MKNLILPLLISTFLACSEKSTTSEAYIPELQIKDSLVIAHLTRLSLIDVKEDHSEYLFYDYKTNEFLRVDSSGKILLQVNRSGDGKDNYQSSDFISANYTAANEILLFTYAKAYYYTLDFSLKHSESLDFSLFPGKSFEKRVTQVFSDYLYTFSIEMKDADLYYESDNFSIVYPFMNIRNVSNLDIISSDSIPSESQPAINPGYYNNLDPSVRFVGDELYALFPNSPEIYIYQYPDLNLKRSFSLKPGEHYKQTLPKDLAINFDGFLKELAGSSYKGFALTNDYLLTMYEGAAPQEEVDKLPKENVGGKEFTELAQKYKSKIYYQIFKDEKRLWEGSWNVNLLSVRDVLYASEKPGEDPDAVEKDMQTIYFYELK